MISVLLGWTERASDWISPIVVKEVRQMVRGREFNYSFTLSLLAGLTVAFLGAADALNVGGTPGSWTFVALMSCLALLGLAIVPLGAFNALRNERMEQTLDLITLTALSPRRVVIGKLLTQGVKLVTFFAGMAPFITMSFLLGGIDFVSILASLAVLFMWSLWVSAACLFLSCLLRSRAMSGLLFGGLGVLLLLLFGVGRLAYTAFARAGVGVFGVGLSIGGPPGVAGARSWLPAAIMTTFCAASMMNLVLLAENRLSLPTENRATPLRIGFLVQFLVIAAATLATHYLVRPGADDVEALAFLGGLHLAIVAMFTVTEDLVVPRRVLRQLETSSRWRLLLALVRPGGGRGAAYVLAQMAIFVAVGWLLDATASDLRLLLAICGYICFFTGVPAMVFRMLKPFARTLYLRGAILGLLPLSLLLPDIMYYVLWRPEAIDFDYAARHLVNPVRTLWNWQTVERLGWFPVPLVLGVAGLWAYIALMMMGRRATAYSVEIEPRSTAAASGEPGSASIAH